MAIDTPAIDLSPRFSYRLDGFPLLPTLILVGIALLALFAGSLAPHDPEIGSLASRFRPPAYVTIWS